MHTSLYEDVSSKYGLERGDNIDERNVQYLHKRIYPQANQRGKIGRKSGQRASIHDAASGIKDFQL